VIDAFALNVRGTLDATLEIPAPSPPPLGDPARNGLIVAGFLAALGIFLNLVQRLRRV